MTLKVTQNKSKQSITGRYPVVLQLILRRKRTLIYTGIRVIPEMFDESRGRVRFIKKAHYSRGQVNAMNKHIEQMYRQFSIFIETELIKHPHISTKELGAKFRRGHTQNTLFALFETIIKDKYSENKIGSARSYESTFRKIKQLRAGIDIRINQLTPEHIRFFSTKAKTRRFIGKHHFVLSSKPAQRHQSLPRFGCESKFFAATFL